MQTIESIRKNIRSAEDLRDIVKTMRTLSAVNIHHFERAVESINDYYRSVEMGLQVLLRAGSVTALQQRQDARGGCYYLVFGSDQGLCGGFNDQIVSHASEVIRGNEIQGSEDTIACAGTRTRAALEEKKHQISEVISVPGGLSSVTPVVQRIVLSVTSLQSRGKISRVMMFHHRLVSQLSYQPASVSLLPIDKAWIQSVQRKKWPSSVIPVFTMERDKLFSALFRQYIFVSLFRAFSESMACENAARLQSMQSAEKNIVERLDQLGALFRTERQQAITGEILDIVSGFEALREKEE